MKLIKKQQIIKNVDSQNFLSFPARPAFEVNPKVSSLPFVWWYLLDLRLLRSTSMVPTPCPRPFTHSSGPRTGRRACSGVAQQRMPIWHATDAVKYPTNDTWFPHKGGSAHLWTPLHWAPTNQNAPTSGGLCHRAHLSPQHVALVHHQGHPGRLLRQGAGPDDQKGDAAAPDEVLSCRERPRWLRVPRPIRRRVAGVCGSARPMRHGPTPDKSARQ